jgi:hypothetical protein
MKSIVISVLVAFGAICSVACSSEPVPDSAPVRVQVKDADNIDPNTWPCWRWWYGCSGDAELTDCTEKNGWTDEGTYCNGCGYTCTTNAQ